MWTSELSLCVFVFVCVCVCVCVCCADFVLPAGSCHLATTDKTESFTPVSELNWENWEFPLQQDSDVSSEDVQTHDSEETTVVIGVWKWSHDGFFSLIDRIPGMKEVSLLSDIQLSLNRIFADIYITTLLPSKFLKPILLNPVF